MGHSILIVIVCEFLVIVSNFNIRVYILETKKLLKNSAYCLLHDQHLPFRTLREVERILKNLSYIYIHTHTQN